jgi:hypothetical protein
MVTYMSLIDTVPGIVRTPAIPAQRTATRVVDITDAVRATPGAGVQARRRALTFADLDEVRRAWADDQEVTA